MGTVTVRILTHGWYMDANIILLHVMCLLHRLPLSPRTCQEYADVCVENFDISSPLDNDVCLCACVYTRVCGYIM